MLRKNLVTIIFVVGIAIALALFYFGVISYYQEISAQRAILKTTTDKIEKQIKKQTDTPSKLWIAQYAQRQAELDKEIAECKNYYNARDAVLGKWFDGLKLGVNGIPSEGDFKSRYQKEKDILIKLIKDKKIYGVAEDESAPEPVIDEGKDLGFAEPNIKNLAELQKRFWIQKKLFHDMTDSNIAKCEKLGFPAVIAANRATFSYGIPIPFQLTVLIQNNDIPLFVHNILDSRNGREGPALNILIKSMAITRLFEELSNLPEIKEEDKTIAETERSNYKPSSIKLPLSRLTVDGEVLDFNFLSAALSRPGGIEGGAAKGFHPPPAPNAPKKKQPDKSEKDLPD